MCSLRRAHVLVFKGKAEVIEELDRPLCSATAVYPWPHVIRLVNYVRVPRMVQRKISRRALFARDGWQCVYCGTSSGRLTLDHVIPRSRGGGSVWENVVTSCAPCNLRKGNRLPARGAHGADPPAAAARAGALHPARDAEDPEALGALPQRVHGREVRSRRVADLSRARPAARGAAPTPTTSPGYRRPSRPARWRRCSGDAGGDAGAAVGDELARRQLRQRLVPRRVERRRGSGRAPVDRVRLAAPPRRRAARRRRRARRGGRRARRGAIVSSLRSRGSNVPGSGRSSPLRRAARASASRSITAQSSWPKWRSSHQSRSAPPSEPYATTKTPAPIPAAPAARAKSRRRGSGCRPPAPGGAERSRSTSRNAAPGMCPARYCARPQPGSSSDQRQSTNWYRTRPP